MTISTFIVVKNEAETLAAALESAGAFSDEIIIGIDDTTDDRTVDVIGDFLPAFSGEVEIFEFTWKESFARARNEAINRCTGDWVFQLDGHEFLRPGDELKIRELTEKLPDDIHLVAVELWDEWRDGKPNSRFFQDHLWRNGKDIRYEGDMHNYISKETCPPENRTRCPEIVIYHRRTAENAALRREQRLEMAEKILLPRVRGDSADLRSLFYLAQTYLNSEILAKADKYYRLYTRESERRGIPSDSEHAWALYKRGMIALARKKYNRALNLLFEGLKHRADSPEIWLAAGEAFMLQGKAREAERFLITAANTKPHEDHLFNYGFATGHGPWLRLSQLYMETGEYAKAFRAGMTGLSLAENNEELLALARASLAYAAKEIPVEDPQKENLYILDADGTLPGEELARLQQEYNVIIQDRTDYAHMTWADITYIRSGEENSRDATRFKFKCRVCASPELQSTGGASLKNIHEESELCVIMQEAGGDQP